jgi:hypothetical protein
MLTVSFRRTAVLVSLVAVLATPWASAAGPGAGGIRPAHVVESASPDLLDLVLSLFRLKAGCHLDPNGRCYASAAQPSHTKAGCKLDPNGRCLP